MEIPHTYISLLQHALPELNPFFPFYPTLAGLTWLFIPLGFFRPSWLSEAEGREKCGSNVECPPVTARSDYGSALHKTGGRSVVSPSHDCD
jgi:hypothetical protein